METGVVRHIAAVDPGLPVAVPHDTRDGAQWGTVPGVGGARHFVRLLPLLPGRNGAATELSHEAIRDFGALSARLGGPPAATSTRRPGARSCGTSSTSRRSVRTSRSSPTTAGGPSSSRSSTASRPPSPPRWRASGRR